MLKAVKIKLYPNKTQKVYINQLLGCYRLVYNICLDKKITAYELDKTNLNFYELEHYFHQDLTKSSGFTFLNEHNTKVLKQAIFNMFDGFKRFFKKQGGFPKFKAKHNSKQSCNFPAEAISKVNDYQSNRLTLTKQIKNIKFKTSKENQKYLTKYQKNIRSATLTHTKSDNYFLSILVDGSIDKILPKSAEIVGIDLGIKDFIVTSNGKKFENIKSIRNNQNKIKHLQRLVSKKLKGSNNKNKARIKLAKYHEKLINVKENYLHLITNQLLNENQIIVMEDLNVSGMLKNHNLARSVQELSLNRFKNILTYKAQWYDREIIMIDRWFPSSKLCSDCGYKKTDLKLSDREWVCPVCGVIHDRDTNAAINIVNEGIRILTAKAVSEVANATSIIGHRLPDFKLADNPTMDDRLSDEVLKSSGWLKQEIKLLSNI